MKWFTSPFLNLPHTSSAILYYYAIQQTACTSSWLAFNYDPGWSHGPSWLVQQQPLWVFGPSRLASVWLSETEFILVCIELWLIKTGWEITTKSGAQFEKWLYFVPVFGIFGSTEEESKLMGNKVNAISSDS